MSEEFSSIDGELNGIKSSLLITPKGSMMTENNLSKHFEIGLYSFVEITSDPVSGKQLNPADRMRNLLETIELADQVGLDVFGLGEHHRPDFISSAPEVILAAAAARTKNIRLTSAVTVLSSDDPVRVFQAFATLDLLCNGRAEIMAGRGSFIESFPLFGFELKDYNDLFAEKLELLLKVRSNERITWHGKHRAALDGQGVYPRPVQNPLPVWVAVGGTPESVVRAAVLGLPMALAIIGGMPERFKPLLDLYREAAKRSGYDPANLAISINSHGFLADESHQAAEDYWPSYQQMMGKIGKERGWPPVNRAQFEEARKKHGSDFIGDADQVIEKILYQHELFNHQRFLVQFGVGAIDHKKMMRAIELLGTKVAPVVRQEIARRLA